MALFVPAAAAVLCSPATADGGGAAPSSPADGQPPASPAPPPFQLQELSIGEPISLPNATPLPAARGAPAPSPQSPSPIVPPAVPAAASTPTASAPAATGTGWLGIAVDDALLTGRLVVVEVAPDSPAAKAGVRQEDVLLAINGTKIQTADEMAAALAAISPGQQVKVAIGRDNKVDDLMMTAAQRPADAMTRNWQSAVATAPTTPARTATESPGRLPVSSPPPTTVPADLRPPAAVAAAPFQPNAAAALPPAAPATAFSSSAPMLSPPSAFGQARSAGASLQAAPPAAVPATAVLPTAPPAGAIAVAATGSVQTGGRVALGVRTVPVDSAVQSRFHMADSRGAFVIGVVEDLPAAKAGVPPGSVIVALNQQPVGSPAELTSLVTRGPVGTPVTLHYVLPGGQSRQASVVLQSLDEPLERALVGTDSGLQPIAASPLQPAPQIARRPARDQQAAAASAADGSLTRFEEMLRRMEARLEQIERRLERLQPDR